MSNGPPQFADFWPASQLLITADTAGAVSAILHPKYQLTFLDEMTAFAGPAVFAESLVYSTPRGNTGWTALRMGVAGHVTYHHWDHARPNLLQLDVFGIGPIDERGAVDAVREFWVPLGMRAFLIKRTYPDLALDCRTLRDDAARRPHTHEGLGPGDHLHLFVDQVSGSPPSIKPDTLDAALYELVSLLKMRGMTPVMRQHQNDAGEGTYNAIIGITTSHISLRVRQSEGLSAISLDIFSCRNFETASVFRWLDRIMPAVEARRGVLYNRFPVGAFEVIM